MSILQEYADLKKQMDAVKDRFRKEGKKVLKELASEFFTKYQWVKEFSWTQYTPHFNDGEPCRFSADTGYPEINGVCDYWSEGCGAGSEKEFSAAYKELQERLAVLDEDLLLALFGDGVKVVVTPKGATAEEYDHD